MNNVIYTLLQKGQTYGKEWESATLRMARTTLHQKMGRASKSAHQKEIAFDKLLPPREKSSKKTHIMYYTGLAVDIQSYLLRFGGFWHIWLGSSNTRL